jgi:hypothetical protein
LSAPVRLGQDFLCCEIKIKKVYLGVDICVIITYISIKLNKPMENRMNNMSKLVEIWNDWITANNLPSQARSMSASELLWEEYINEDQERFINAFLEMWESMSVYTSSWDQ